MSKANLDRRRFQKLLTQLSVGALVGLPKRPLFGNEVTEDRTRPNMPCGVAAGDVEANSATLWSRCDREARMIIELADNPEFKNRRRLVGPEVLEHSDLTGKVRVTGLSPGQVCYYRISFQDLESPQRVSLPTTGQFKTAPTSSRNISFVWSGDTAGQGYGIDVARGGMRSFESIRQLQPDFFVNSGDICYVDNPFPSEIKLDDGTVWKNIVTEATSKVAETLDEFRANYRYNLLDENLRRLNAEVPMFVQWDDHEVLNNWYPTEVLNDDRYQVKSVDLLAARARQAFLDYMPIRQTADGFNRIYRQQSYGPLLDLFFLDQRSYRGPNSPNRQESTGPATHCMGPAQIQWLKKRLSASRATWKVLCSDMPFGIVVGDGPNGFDNCANGDGPALGRELEIADLLSFMKREKINNTVWLTADVHYAASHYYDPNQAKFQDFEPFWEFVSGPLHAGTFGPGTFDNTFGPQLKFKSIPDGMKGNRPPSEGLQFFGHIQIDAQSQAMTVSHYNSAGKQLWNIQLDPLS